MFYQIIKKMSLAYVVMLVAFTGLMIAAHCIPSEALYENVKRSTLILEDEGAYHKIANFKLFQLDNFTDALMLNLAVSADAGHPVDAAMMNYYNWDGDCFTAAKCTERYMAGDTIGLKHLSYARYWQGYQTFLRPILTMTDYSGIRILNFVLLFSLAFGAFALLYRKAGRIVALIFGAVLLIFGFPIVPLSMQFSTCFYLAFIGMIAVMLCPRLTMKESSMTATFFIIGGVVAYLDFLTTPQLTLGLPLIAMLLTQHKKKTGRVVLLCGIAWALGYGLLWASKWMVGWLLTGNSILADAMQQAEIRTSNLYKGMEMTVPNILRFIWDNIKAHGLEWAVWTVLAMTAVGISVYCKMQCGWKRQKEYAWLWLMIMFVPIWYAVLRNHSLQHGWFTWRAALLSVFAFVLWVYFTTRKNNLTLKNNEQ